MYLLKESGKKSFWGSSLVPPNSTVFKCGEEGAEKFSRGARVMGHGNVDYLSALLSKCRSLQKGTDIFRQISHKKSSIQICPFSLTKEWKLCTSLHLRFPKMKCSCISTCIHPLSLPSFLPSAFLFPIYSFSL